MADEYIKCDAVYDTLTEYYHHRTDIQHGALREALSRVPAADVVEAVRRKDCASFTGKIVDKLCDYEDAEAQGLLVRLPYKAGDTVFIISEGCVLEVRIFGIVVYYNCMTIMDSKNNEWVVARNRVFLTREEAADAWNRRANDG